MDQEVANLIGAIALAMLIFFVLPFIALMALIKRRARSYKEAATLRHKYCDKNKQSPYGSKVDYTVRRWRITYAIVSILILTSVLIGVFSYNNQRVCETWSRGSLDGSTIWDRYENGSTCKTLGERSEGLNMNLIGLGMVGIAILGWVILPAIYRYATPSKQP